MPTLKVDGVEVTVEQGSTVIQACEAAGKEIPRFCYHERLQIAGNCRMCLVEVKPGPPKPAASCALPAGDGMEVFTDTHMVKKAREGVMEFLLINHPLDCPICDQGGECDLQDQAISYGRGESRYEENKRAVKDKHMGPLIKTHMTRCIHCTRCVRFAEDIAGVPELGAISRGEDMQITTYLDKALDSELSANVIDLCPVGALTSRPYAFKSRPWELKPVESVDVLDAVGSNIRVDTRGQEVMRVLPRLHEDVNEEWISDKTRYACDGLRSQRLDRPMIRKKGKLQPASWHEALRVVAEKLTNTAPEKMGAIVGDLVDMESTYALRLLMDRLHVANRDCRQDGAALDASSRASYLFNSTIAGIEDADLIVLVGTNPRIEAPLVNARIRKAYLNNGVVVMGVGEEVHTTYPIDWLGNDPTILSKLTASQKLGKALKASKKPMIILGMGALTHADGAAILRSAMGVADEFGLIQEDWNGFNVLHTAAARVGALELGFVPQEKGLSATEMVDAASNGDMDVLYLLGADEIDTSRLGKSFVIYQGHHGDAGAHRADVIFPGAAYTEKNGTYMNMEGRPQRGWLAVQPPGEAREDWKILRALSEVMGMNLPFDHQNQLRAALERELPHVAALDEITPAEWSMPKSRATRVTSKAFEPVIHNFYMTDPISRASKTMAECSQAFIQTETERSAA